MAETVEATGRTLDEAKQQAAEALGAAVDECEFEVIEQAAKGLFAKSNFRVRAVRKPQERPVKAAVGMPAKEEPVADALAEEPAKEKPARAKRPAKKAAKAEADIPPRSDGDKDRADVEATEKDSEAVVEIVEGLIERADLDVEVKVASIGGKYVNLHLTGDDTEALLDNKGSGLDSLQYLANAMLTRKLGNGVRLTLDAKEYRSHRATALEKLATEVATAVVERKQEAVLDALPAHERRVIHKVLKDFDGVETYSEGEEPNRHVVISPKK